MTEHKMLNQGKEIWCCCQMEGFSYLKCPQLYSVNRPACLCFASLSRDGSHLLLLWLVRVVVGAMVMTDGRSWAGDEFTEATWWREGGGLELCWLLDVTLQTKLTFHQSLQGFLCGLLCPLRVAPQGISKEFSSRLYTFFSKR